MRAAFRVAWLDGAADFGRGLAYGRAAHPKFLLNNDVSCMIQVPVEPNVQHTICSHGRYDGKF